MIDQRMDRGFLPEKDPLAGFRETHLEFARRYVAAHVRDPRGTGGTPYLEWLSQLIDENRAHMIS
jgi:indoleamine 2,3-dioxygenase